MARTDPKKVTRMPGGRSRPAAPHPPRGPVAVEDLNPSHMARHQFHTAAHYLKLKPWLREMLARPRRQLTVAIPVRLDDGSYRVFEGYRVQHNVARGPAFGGLRCHPGLTLDEVSALAAWSTWRCALIGLPFGGAHGGILCNPKESSLAEIERMMRRYAAEAYGPGAAVGPFLSTGHGGAGQDVLAPDLGTDAQTMAWIFDVCAAASGSSCAVTGKPPLLGGQAERADTVARACVLAVRQACKERKLPLKGARVVVQGYGHVGAAVARLLRAMGAAIVGISDSRGGVFNAAQGIDPLRAEERRQRRGSVAGMPDASRVTNEALLAQPCDILILAALHNQITTLNADRIQAAIVAEAACGATTPGADKILSANGVMVVPDLLAGSGGAIASYVEWAHDRLPSSWSGTKLETRVEEIVERCFGDLLRRSKEFKVDLRTAAWILAVGRVAETTMTRGLNP